METLVRTADLAVNNVVVKNGVITVTKFYIEEIPNPLVRKEGDKNPHLLVTPYDGLKPGAVIPYGVDATGYALPNKGQFMVESLLRPVDLYRKEMAEDGTPVWKKVGYDPNVSLFDLINLKRLDRQTQKQNAVPCIDAVLGTSCDTPAPPMNWWQRFVIRRAERKIESERRFKLNLRHEWVYHTKREE